ncbi:MAG TPA: flavodoxin family protein [Flavisolibacter sp.]|nr:flavodoxin family protein [Flavisolibacter sp.]
MQKAIISIVYHSQYGHTEQAAIQLADLLEANQVEVNAISVGEVYSKWQLLHDSDMIVFGCPTLFGNVSSGFKTFMEETGAFWYRQLWKNKLAAGFTVSSTSGGDKLNTLQSIALFAAQHSMHWVSLGVLPRFLNDHQTDGQNRLASYLGLMMQTDNAQKQVASFHSGDLLTMELFAKRLTEVTTQFKKLNTIDNDSIRN